MPNADYAIISLNISHSPLTIFFGACLPAECIQDDYWKVTKAATDLITGLYKGFLGNATPDTGNFRAWTEISITVRKTDEIQQEWKEDSKSGFIAFMAIVIPLLVLVSCAPSIYHIFKRRYESGADRVRLQQAGLSPMDASAAGPDQPLLMNSTSSQQQMLNINQTNLYSTAGLGRTGQNGLSTDLTREASGRLVSGAPDNNNYLPSTAQIPLTRRVSGMNGLNYSNDVSSLHQSAFQPLDSNANLDNNSLIDLGANNAPL